ncbi:hypothetical protein CUMW_248270 [Citrus unshiu]|uniref:nucleoside-diphosphate kinase n=1 Tax=Citrus unshiu TaxID=55188 RepID=A0A2H5QP67_CITUN|nr:hypothetical protein CUMW_248270 [Citrus unshiu]
MEQTFIMIKPDGVQRGSLLKSSADLRRRGLKPMTVDHPFAQKHYEDLLSKPFFGALIGYITSSPVIAMIWEGAIIVIILNFFNK